MGLTPFITWVVIDPIMRVVTTETRYSSAVDMRASGSASWHCSEARMRALCFDTAVMLRRGLQTLCLGIAVMLGRRLQASCFGIIVMLRCGLRALRLAIENAGFMLCKTRASNSAS